MHELLDAPRAFLERHGLDPWQWGALVLLMVCSAALGAILSRLVRKLLDRFARRTPFDWDSALIERSGAPLALAIAVAICLFALPLVELGPRTQRSMVVLLRLGWFAATFWALVRGTDIVVDAISSSAWAKRNRATRSLIKVAARALKVLLVVAAVVGLLSELDYPVSEHGRRARARWSRVRARRAEDARGTCSAPFRSRSINRSAKAIWSGSTTRSVGWSRSVCDRRASVRWTAP